MSLIGRPKSKLPSERKRRSQARRLTCERLEQREVMDGASLNGLYTADPSQGQFIIADTVSDLAGSTYVAGVAQPLASNQSVGPVDIDPAHTYADNRDILEVIDVNSSNYESLMYVAKYLPNGLIDWVGRADCGCSSASVKLVEAPNSGGVYFAGIYGGPMTIGTTSITTAQRYAGKFNSNGSLAWLKGYTIAAAALRTGGIAVDEARGMLYVSGNHALTNPGRESGVVIGLNIANPANVQVAWSANLAMSGNVYYPNSSVESIVVDTNGNVISLAQISGTGDFDPGAGKVSLSSGTGTKSNSGVIWKLSRTGTYVSAQQFESANNSGYSFNDVAIDAANNLYVSGTFGGTVDFQAGKSTLKLTSAGGADVFLVKLNPLGAALYAKKFGGATDDSAGYITLDASNVYITGITRNSSGVVTTTFVNKYTQADGNLVWQYQIVGQTAPLGGNWATWGISVNRATGQVWVLGRFVSLDTDGNGVPDLFTSDGQPRSFWLVLNQI